MQEIITGTSADSTSLASNRASMLSKACETCKLKKSRCDSARPQCDTCRRKGVACVYREKGQPGLRPGFGKAIERRLALLEDNMEKMNQSMQDVLCHVRGPDTSTITSTGTGTTGFGGPNEVNIDMDTSLPVPDPGSPTVVVGESTIGSQGLDNNPPPVWQTSEQLPDVTSFTSSPVVMDRLPPSLTIPGHLTATATATMGNNNGLPTGEVLQELVDLFFKLVYPWLPLFHRPSFTANMFLPERQILLHGIVVIAFRLWRKPTPPAEVRDAYVKASRERILLGTVDACSLVSTQALALLALDAVGQGPGPRTWNMMSMLVTTARHLSLAKSFASPANPETNTPLVRNEDPEDDDDLDLSSIEAEEKRRLFWVIYSLDRFSSVSHGQSGGIDTRNIRLPYPAGDDDWGQAGAQATSAPEWFQPTASLRPATTHAHCSGNLWHHYIDLLAMMDRSNQLLIQPVNLTLPAHCQEWQSSFRRLDMALSTWFENLPRHVREPPAAFDPMWTMVHATFHLICTRMYTVAAFPSTTSPYLRPSSSAQGRCRRTVRDVASLTASLRPDELNQLGPMFAFVVWVAARTLIILWTTGHETAYGAMPADLETLLSGLGHLSASWPCAQRYTDIIRLILDTRNQPGGPTGLDIFNDTRRTAYGLQNRLGMALPGLAALRAAAEAGACSYYPPLAFDFLDVPANSLDMGDLACAAPWAGAFGSEMDGEWL